MGILLRLAASAAAVWVATLILPGMDVTAETTLGEIGTYVAIAVLFGVVNAVLRPVIKMVGCGLYIFTLGLIAFVVNALLLMLTGLIAGWLDVPFEAGSFWPDAVLGAVIIGVVSTLLNWFVKNGDK
jgi:putative membrane protein